MPQAPCPSPLASRCAQVQRNSKETDITLSLALNSTIPSEISTGFGLLDHMLTLTAFWAGIHLKVQCTGDLHIDAHHSAEDVALCLGQALRQALGEAVGIARVGHGRVPMDEALTDVTMDISGRPWLEWRGDELLPPVMGGQERDIWREFYKTFAATARCNLHISFLYGKNGHHLLESLAKGLGLALAQAVQISGNTVRSTKGGLD
ncbi:MAG: imidazoleglycerol-phosphate dehydratase [Desulfovibrionaceae bacterium]